MERDINQLVFVWHQTAGVRADTQKWKVKRRKEEKSEILEWPSNARFFSSLECSYSFPYSHIFGGGGGGGG